MPLTPNGKIDRNKLPFPDTAAIRQRQKGAPGRIVTKLTPPRTMLESRLVSVPGRTSSLRPRPLFFVKRRRVTDLALVCVFFGGRTLHAMAHPVPLTIGGTVGRRAASACGRRV